MPAMLLLCRRLVPGGPGQKPKVPRTSARQNRGCRVVDPILPTCNPSRSTRCCCSRNCSQRHRVSAYMRKAAATPPRNTPSLWAKATPFAPRSTPSAALEPKQPATCVERGLPDVATYFPKASKAKGHGGCKDRRRYDHHMSGNQHTAHSKRAPHTCIFSH